MNVLAVSNASASRIRSKALDRLRPPIETFGGRLCEDRLDSALFKAILKSSVNKIRRYDHGASGA